MQENYQNIYQIARQSAGITQERAAELLAVSVKSLQDYEGDRRRPPDALVARMADVYGTLHLGVQHLRTNEAAQAFMPNIELKDLPEAVIALLVAVKRFDAKHHALLEITQDGRIDEHEQAEWDEILAALQGVVDASMDVKFAKQKE